MSVANIAFAEDRILVLSDTLTYADGQAVGLCDRKTEIVGPFAVTYRGRVTAGDLIHAFIQAARDLDHAERILPEAHSLFLEIKQDTDSDASVETTIMGWSEKRGDLAVLRWTVSENATAVRTETLGRGLHLAPSFPGTSIPALPPNIDDAMMVKVALAQATVNQQRLERDAGAYKLCIGGAMHLTEITHQGASQRLVGTYPDYDTHAALFPDPNAEAVAAFLAAKVVPFEPLRRAA